MPWLGIIAGNTVEISSARSDRSKVSLFNVSLVDVGFGVDLGRLRRLGGRPLALRMAAWVLVAGMAYLAVLINQLTPTIEAMIDRLPAAYCLPLAVGVWRLACVVSSRTNHLILVRIVRAPGSQV